MTVRVTPLKGDEAGRYYTDRLREYYLDGGEPPGAWWGRGADQLGLAGHVDAAAFDALMAGNDPTTGHRLGRRYGDNSVRGFDVTFSAPKSVSVLFGVGDLELRCQVTEAQDRAVAAVLAWIEQHAHTRLRQRGHVVCVDADGVVAATFRHHTSRALDAQIHTHAVVANRVQAPDGRWLALDARALFKDQRTLSALYHANLRAELARRLGVEWHDPVNGIAEIAGIDDAILAEFSQRTQEMQRRLDVKLARFHTDMFRDPTHHERWQLGREAVLDSRPHKPHGHSAEDLHQWWQRRLGDLGLEPQQIIGDTTGREPGRAGIDRATANLMVRKALDALVEEHSTWRPAELVRELAATVPTDVAGDPDQLTRYVEQLAGLAADKLCVDLSPEAPVGVPRRRDGRPVTEPAIGRALTTRGILDEEARILEWGERCQQVKDLTSGRRRRVNGDEHLTEAQAEACSAVAQGSSMELIVGPAGTGKTTALAPAVKYRQMLKLGVFGVAPTAAAAEVLAAETGVTADTLDKLLHEHRRSDRQADPVYDLPRGATVIVDEAGTVSTPKLAHLVDLAQQRQWRLVLVGDPQQFSAVGRGGMFAHLVDTYGAIELDQVHRFTHPWEREASLRLRNGDPGVLAEYGRHGRLHAGTPEDMAAAILTAWTEACDRGEIVALMANNNDTVDHLNHAAQQIRIAQGELDPTGPALRTSSQRLLIGDEVVTRRNDRTLRTTTGKMIKNRDHWTIDAISPQGTVTLIGQGGTVTLPAKYAQAHLELGYAQTSHATQGRTVDTALLLVDVPIDSAGIYTPMTRGRHANHAYVATDDDQSAAEVLCQGMSRDWIDRPATAHASASDRARLAPPSPRVSRRRRDTAIERGISRQLTMAAGSERDLRASAVELALGRPGIQWSKPHAPGDVLRCSRAGLNGLFSRVSDV